MRIEKVVIENINSLAGRFEVDFTDRGYSGGLFALVGPSGAGKTTVLDAICLALYGQTPRIGTISATQDELMTKGEDACLAEAVFVSRGRRYKSAFAHKRSNGSNPFRLVDREIIEYTENGPVTVASGIRECDAKIVEVTGLDYSRFTRSIMLAQFRFAEFLNANATDRAAILEQITDMEIYRRISEEVYKRARSEEAALEQIRIRSSLIAVPDEAEEAALRHEQKRLEAVLPAQSKLREALRQCGDALTGVGRLEKMLADDTAQMPVLQKVLADSEKRLTEATKAEQGAVSALEALRATLKKVRALDIQIEAQQKECSRIDLDAKKQDAAVRERKLQILEVYKKYEPDASDARFREMYATDHVGALLRAGVQAELDETEKQHRAVKAKIASLMDGQDEVYWQSRIEMLKTTLALFEANGTLEKAQAESEEEANTQKALIEQHKQAMACVEEASERYAYALLDQRFGEERRKLAEGTPCPLCGATQHPYAGNEEQEGFFAAAEDQKKEAEAALLRIERSMAESGQRRIDIAKRIKEHQQTIEKYREALGGEPPETTAEQVKAALEDAQQRVRAYPALLNEQAAAAEEVRKRTARMGEIDRDVQAVMMRKEQIAEAQQQAVVLREELVKAQGVLDGYTKQRAELFGSKDADAEEVAAQNTAKAAQELKEQHRAERDKASAALDQNSRDIVRTRDTLEKEQEGLATRYGAARTQAQGLQLPQREDTLYAAYAQAVSALNEAPEQAAISAAAGTLEALVADGTEHKAIIARNLSVIAENRKALNKLKADENEQKQRVIKWGRIDKFIGSSKGDKFSRMAQGITFDALLRYANASLSRMTDQYVLVRDMEGGKPLELAVLDMYRAGEQRPVSNLSGGESFLVSLALALGLSEMSSGRARIDSLFIDEGFASLDENYLEAALQTLSTLSTREDKLVGVISHVEALKERIDTQIEVRKRTGGRSTLSGPGVTAQEA